MKIILKQSVINKVLKKHNISVNTLRDLPEKLHNPVLVFKSARKDTDAVVVMIDAIDNDGNNIVVAIDLKGRFNQLEVNDITSIYGKDSYEGYANWAENIITGDEKKVKAWIQSLPENDRRGVSKSMLSRLQEKLHEVLVAGKDSIKNPSMQENGGNNSQQEENGGGRVSFMVSEERDADYMDAVEKGDSEKAGRMVRRRRRGPCLRRRWWTRTVSRGLCIMVQPHPCERQHAVLGVQRGLSFWDEGAGGGCFRPLAAAEGVLQDIQCVS